MESKSVDSILSFLLGGVGLIILVIGCGLMESDYFIQAFIVDIIGLALLVWGCYEDGYFRANKK